MEERSANPHDDDPVLSGDLIIQFGIFCCAVTMVIVLAVALLAK